MHDAGMGRVPVKKKGKTQIKATRRIEPAQARSSRPGPRLRAGGLCTARPRFTKDFLNSESLSQASEHRKAAKFAAGAVFAKFSHYENNSRRRHRRCGAHRHRLHDCRELDSA